MTPGPGAAPGDRGAGKWGPAGPSAGDRATGDRDAGGRRSEAAAWPGDRRGPTAPVDPSGDVEGAEGPIGEPEAEEVPGGTILTDVAALAAERDEYLTALQRLQADFENYRKRVQRQQEEQALRAATDVVGKVLPVLDTLDLARAHLGGGEGSEEAKALDQARSQLLDVLSKEGLERVDEVGVEFDPVVHDAVAHAPAETASTAEAALGGESPATGGVTVDEVLRAGYRWRGQVLRPAMVRVRG
jgi:molecular chaperone GrpE